MRLCHPGSNYFRALHAVLLWTFQQLRLGLGSFRAAVIDLQLAESLNHRLGWCLFGGLSVCIPRRQPSVLAARPGLYCPSRAAQSPSLAACVTWVTRQPAACPVLARLLAAWAVFTLLTVQVGQQHVQQQATSRAVQHVRLRQSVSGGVGLYEAQGTVRAFAMRPPAVSVLLADRRKVPTALRESGGSITEAARRLGRSASFVRRWASSKRQREGCRNKRGGGRKRLLTGEAKTRAKRLATAVQTTSAAAIATQLHREGLTARRVSASTVQRALNSGKVPVRYLPLRRQQRPTQKHKDKRVAWAREHSITAWSRCLFTDSHIFQVGKSTTGRRRYQRVSRRMARTTRRDGLKVHIYGGVCKHGLTNLQFVSGTTGFQYKSPTTGRVLRSVGAEEYRDVLARTLVPEGRRLLGGGRWFLYQDGASAHTAHKTRTYLSRIPDVQLVQASPMSPDLNIAECAWAELDRKLDGRDFHSMQALKRAVEGEWAAITEEWCKKQVDSMQRRVGHVIEHEGGHWERCCYS